MKFLKVLINSLVSGFFFDILLALLILDLNINLIFDIYFFGQLTLFLAITYGLLITMLCILSFFIIQFFTGKKFNIAFVSPSFLMISFTLLTLIFLLIFWENYNFFLSFFNPEICHLLKPQAMTLLFLAILGILAFIGKHKYKKGIFFFLVYFILFGGAITYTIFKRTKYPVLTPPEKIARLETKEIDKKITIIGLEGLSFDFIIPLINEEKLPNFSWLMEEGSWGKLESFSPNEALILNSSFNTGKFPFKHRQLSLYKYRILNFKKEITVVPRFIFFRQLTRTNLLKISPNPTSSFSKDMWKIFESNKTSFLKKDWPYDTVVKEPSQKSETLFNTFFQDLRFETSEIFINAKTAFLSDIALEEEFFQEKSKIQPQLSYFLLSGLNTVETYFYKYSFPDLFGELDQEELNKYSSLIEKYYEFYDQIIGKYIASKKDDELLIIYSPHGIEPLPFWKRIIEWILGNADICAYHDYGPAGVFFFLGKDMVRGKNIEGMELIDIAPTILNYLGLPVGKDMDGVVCSSVFINSFKIENPVLYISSYEEIDIKKPE